MDIENQLFKEFVEFMEDEISYDLKIVPKTPKGFVSFPTLIFKESSNTDYFQGKSLNGLEYVDSLLYTVEIYTKDMVINNTKKHSREIMQELKQAVFKFFRHAGFERMTCERGEYPDFDIDRLIIVEQGQVNNWNKEII